jgi:hypothetical protein
MKKILFVTILALIPNLSFAQKPKTNTDIDIWKQIYTDMKLTLNVAPGDIPAAPTSTDELLIITKDVTYENALEALEKLHAGKMISADLKNTEHDRYEGDPRVLWVSDLGAITVGAALSQKTPGLTIMEAVLLEVFRIYKLNKNEASKILKVPGREVICLGSHQGDYVGALRWGNSGDYQISLVGKTLASGYHVMAIDKSEK